MSLTSDIKARLTKINFIENMKLNIYNPSFSLMVLALTQVPVGIIKMAELACIGELSNQIWRETGSHKAVNINAVNKCNGGN